MAGNYIEKNPQERESEKSGKVGRCEQIVPTPLAAVRFTENGCLYQRISDKTKIWKWPSILPLAVTELKFVKLECIQLPSYEHIQADIVEKLKPHRTHHPWVFPLSIYTSLSDIVWSYQQLLSSALNMKILKSNNTCGFFFVDWIPVVASNILMRVF